MRLIDIFIIIKRMASRSPKLFRAIQLASFGTAVISAILLYMSKNHMITLPNSEVWDEFLKIMIYSGLGSGGTASATTTNPDLISHEVKNNIINFNDKANIMDEITGYYVTLPAGAQILNSINGEEYNTLISDYAGATYYPETAEFYGIYEWDASITITGVIIDGGNVPVQSLIGGTHAPHKPKPK